MELKHSNVCLTVCRGFVLSVVAYDARESTKFIGGKL